MCCGNLLRVWSHLETYTGRGLRALRCGLTALVPRLQIHDGALEEGNLGPVNRRPILTHNAHACREAAAFL